MGKSCLINAFLNGKFIEEYDPTIENSHRVQIQVDGFVHMLDILDTAGQEDLSTMQGEWFRSGEGFILMYAINERKTFQEVTKLHMRIEMIKQGDTPMVLCGSKVDLVRLCITNKINLFIPFPPYHISLMHIIASLFSIDLFKC